jgi:RND family efflux transporter MFP subunit
MLKYCPLLSLVLLLAACGDAAAPPPATETSVIVETALVQSVAGDDTARGTGTLEREREITLSFRIPGVVARLTVDDGDDVQRGMLIASLDATAVDARARQAAADLEKAQRDFARDKQLAAQGWISTQRLADRETASKVARANVDAVNFDKRWANLTAPSSGVVLTRHIQAGEVVAPGQPVVTIADEASPLVARIPFADKVVAQLKVGDPAAVTVSALPGVRLAGTVTRIDQRADPRTGAFDVEIRVPAQPGLKTGFVADALVTLRGEPSGPQGQFRIPAEAILDADGALGYVYTVEGNPARAKRRQIQFDGFQGDDALVRGLPTGARVITTGGSYVKDGGRVTLVGVAG